MPLTTPLESRSLGWGQLLSFVQAQQVNLFFWQSKPAQSQFGNLKFLQELCSRGYIDDIKKFCSPESIFGFWFPRRIQERASLETPLTLWAEYEETHSIGAMFEQRNISPVCLLWLRQSQCDKNGKGFPISLVQLSKPCLYGIGKISTNETTGTTCNRKH